MIENSIDYAIMEKAKNLVAIPYLSKWSDLSDWDTVWTELSKDQSGTVCLKQLTLLIVQTPCLPRNFGSANYWSRVKEHYCNRNA